MIMICLHPLFLLIVDQLSLTDLAILIALNVQNIAFDTKLPFVALRSFFSVPRLGFRLSMFQW